METFAEGLPLLQKYESSSKATSIVGSKADHELYPWVSMFQNPYLDSPGFQEPGTYTHGFSGTARHSQAQSGTDLSVL